jgi:hypothetical protein
LVEQQRLIIVVALVTLLKITDELDNNQRIKYSIVDETTAGCDELSEKKNIYLFTLKSEN